MGQHIGESLILRTYPLKESDLIVSFLTRESGKLRGVANRARKPKSGYGAGLERLSHVRLAYFQRENRDLVRIDSAELIRAHFSSASYDHSLALDFMAEVAEILLPADEVNEKYFRLLLAVMDELELCKPEAVWKPITYFALWSVRLQGFLPDVPISDASREIAAAMMRMPVAQIPSDGWTKKTAEDLRRSLIGLIEEHSERRLITVKYLEAL